MADEKHKPMTGPQGAYKRDGLGGVWKWALGHGIKRWLKARNWAHRKAQQVTPKRRAAFRKAEAAYQKKMDWFHHHKHTTKPHGKVVMFDGKPCAHWMAVHFQKARDLGIWTGTLLSGVRTVAESIALCEHMCGEPSCPGRCAGAATNHTCPPTHECSYPEGAGDVTDPAGFQAYCRSHGVPLHGNGEMLPADLNHFSHTGR